MNLENFQSAPKKDRNPEEFSLPDRWIRGRLNQAIRRVQASLEEYKFNEASHTLYQFIWHELCDWYLELVKPFLYQDHDAKAKRLTQEMLLEVLDATLRLLHPFMPFITEEIWQKLPLDRSNGSVMKAEFPKADERFDDEAVEEEMGLIIDLITALRNIRGEMNLSPTEMIETFFRIKSRETKDRIERNQLFIKILAKVKELKVSEEIVKPAYFAFSVVREVEIFVPMSRSKMEEEVRRLQKEILKIEKENALIMKKLSNQQFLSKAPPEVIQEVREKGEAFLLHRKKLEEGLIKIKKMIE